MEPVLEIYDSEDDACIYLKNVQKQSQDYLTRKIILGESNSCEDSFIPKSQIPQNYILSLSISQIESIISKFKTFKESLQQNLIPTETKRSKKSLKSLLFDSRPLLENIKYLDQLSIWKILELIQESIEEYEKLEEWIYCMLVLLEMPLSIDIYSALNSIMIKATEFPNKSSALVIVAIISEYFGQKLR